jgi:hypothetical protein
MTDLQFSGTSGATTNKTQPPMTNTQSSGGPGSTTASDSMEPRKEAHMSEQHVTEQHVTEQQQSGRKTEQSDQNTGQDAGQPSGQHGNQVSGQRTDQQKTPHSQNTNEDETGAQPS